MKKLEYIHDSYGYTSKYTAKIPKHIKVFIETRKNHLEGSYRVYGDGTDEPILEEKYIVFLIPNTKENKEKIKNVFRASFAPQRLYAVEKEEGDCIEFSYHLQQAFITGLVQDFYKVGFLKTFNWLEIPHDKTKGIYYVNAKWYQIPFNMVGLMYDGWMFLLKKIFPKLKGSEE